MGLADTISNAVTGAIAALDDLPKTISYYKVTPGTFNITTDSYNDTEELVTCKGVYYKTQEQRQDYKKTELNQTKVLIAGQVFGTYVPHDKDYMVIDSIKHEIKEIKRIPGDGAFIFTIRQV